MNGVPGRALAAVLRWPWLPPAVAVGAVAAAGALGRGWWLGTVGVVAVAAALVIGGLFLRGRDVA